MSGRPEFVPGGQYILWMVNFALDFVQIAVFCQSISLWVRFSVFPVMSFLIRQCHDALTVGAKGFFAGTWLFSVSWDGDFCCFFFFVGLFLARVQYILLGLVVILLVLFSCFVVH